jgi:hypothetical protein
MGDTPGLSMQSIGIGGATVEGSVTYPDGRVVPVKYSYYNHSIVEAVGSTTWTGAGRAFDMFAHRIARGLRGLCGTTLRRGAAFVLVGHGRLGAGGLGVCALRLVRVDAARLRLDARDTDEGRREDAGDEDERAGGERALGHSTRLLA